MNEPQQTTGKPALSPGERASRKGKAWIFAVAWPLLVSFAAFRFMGFNPVILLIFLASKYAVPVTAILFAPGLVGLHFWLEKPRWWKMILYVLLGLPIVLAITFLGCGSVGPCGNNLH